MNNSAKNRFKSHYKVLRRHYGLDYLPYAPRKNELNREDFLKRIKDDNFIVPNLTDEGFETAKSLSVFFDQRDTMSSKEFNKALTEKYGNELDIERDIREIENSEALRSIERNIKTMKGIMVFFLVMWIIGIVATIIYALAALT
ncbi:MAG: hypothetical protein PHE08_06560 [Bacteroidales bacterium]|nr:hypothetical protein [Bacteroidales bacterium]